MLGWRGALLCVFLSQLWTLTPGSAGKVCSGFGHLENGRMFFRYGGLYVTFTCNPGFRIHGYRTSSCVSGQWARDPPLCVASGCPDPGDLLHGSAVVSKDRSLAFFSCDTGFSLFGSALLYCTGKNWNSTKPVCNVADIMSVLHLNQESLHGPVSAHKPHSNSHLNTIAAHKDAFLKSGLPHFTDVKQTSRKPVEKKPSVNLLFDKTQARALEPTKNTQNFKDPIRSSDLQKPVPVTSKDNTISLASSFHKPSFLTTTPISFDTPSMDTQQVKTIDQRMLDADRSSVTSAADAPNINTLGTNDYLQSGTSIAKDPDIFASPTESYPSLISKKESVSFPPYLNSMPPSPSRGLQTLDFQETSPPPNPTGHTSSSMQVIQIVSDLPPVNEKIRSDTKAWQDLPLFPTRKRPVCPYPPFPSHGTFYFRSIKNPGPLQYKHYIQYACYPGYTLTDGDVYSYCQHNGQWSGQTPLCLELTPCSLNNGGCSQICHVNEHHRAQCICKPGFLLLEDERTCRDLDECVEELHLCQQVCENTLGSFRCSCSPGFQLSPDGTSCADVDECQLVGRALCEFSCINTPGSFQCLCPEGHQLDSTNRHCVDINECEETDIIQHKLLHICEWKCVNLPGTYRCMCPHGYRLHSNGHQCEDINECELKNGSCSHLCINHRGGYKCVCPETHTIFPYNPKNCQPVKTHN